MRRLLLQALVMAGVGCSNTSEICVIEPPDPAAGPAVVNPVSRDKDVVPSSLTIEISAPTDQEHIGTVIEIWRAPGGAPAVLAWRAELTDPTNLLSATLEAGTFEGISATLGLIEWKDYVVRARYQLAPESCESSRDGFTGAPGCCAELSAWSQDRLFRITDRSPEVFDGLVIRQMDLEIPPESFAAIDAEATPPGCVPYVRNYYAGNAVIDGEAFDGVGIRVKGGCGSARNLDGKAAFKVNLSWDDPEVAGCPESRRHRGLKRFTFNNMVQDRSFVHERVAYHFYELMGLAVPRVAHARLSVNGDHWGLYLNVESIDRRMLSRNFDSKDGALYEGTYRCDLVPENVPPNLEPTFCLQAKFGPDSCSSPEPGADPLDYEPIRELTEAIAALPDGEFYPAITELIDWDRYLSLWAADSLLNHWDGYTFEIVNNWRIYHDLSTDRWTVIPTGVDQTFTTREVNPFAPAGLLAIRCLAEPDCESSFVARLIEAADVFEQANLGVLATQIAAQIRPEVELDPRKEGTLQQFDNGQTALQSYISNRPDRIRQYINNR